MFLLLVMGCREQTYISDRALLLKTVTNHMFQIPEGDFKRTNVLISFIYTSHWFICFSLKKKNLLGGRITKYLTEGTWSKGYTGESTT